MVETETTETKIGTGVRLAKRRPHSCVTKLRMQSSAVPHGVPSS